MKNKYESGFSLIEILITLLIVAVGILSIAALQFRGLQYSNDAHMRSNYNVFAYDIMDRMRNNMSDIANYVGDYEVPTTWPGGDVCNEATSPPTAANDLICWRQQLFNHMPPGSNANITTAAGVGYTQYVITLDWTSRDDTVNTIRHMLADPT